MFRQGDKERGLHLTLSALSDRHGKGVTDMQVQPWWPLSCACMRACVCACVSPTCWRFPGVVPTVLRTSMLWCT